MKCTKKGCSNDCPAGRLHGGARRRIGANKRDSSRFSKQPPRTKLIPGEGLKRDHLPSLRVPAVTPNETNPWRGIETQRQHVSAQRREPPNETNPWRGIETLGGAIGCTGVAGAPNETNPWRGIETLLLGSRKS